MMTLRQPPPFGRAWSHRRYRGFTLVEVLIVIAILGILASIAVPLYSQHVERARFIVCVTDLRDIRDRIAAYRDSNGSLPIALSDLPGAVRNDPWGNPYQYLNFSTAEGKGKFRKDRFIVPINSEYDLYSMGKDGVTAPPLTANISRDDVVMGNDGGYFGYAVDF